MWCQQLEWYVPMYFHEFKLEWQLWSCFWLSCLLPVLGQCMRMCVSYVSCSGLLSGKFSRGQSLGDPTSSRAAWVQEKPQTRASQAQPDISLFEDSENYWELQEAMKDIAVKHGQLFSIHAFILGTTFHDLLTTVSMHGFRWHCGTGSHSLVVAQTRSVLGHHWCQDTKAAGGQFEECFLGPHSRRGKSSCESLSSADALRMKYTFTVLVHSWGCCLSMHDYSWV